MIRTDSMSPLFTRQKTVDVRQKTAEKFRINPRNQKTMMASLNQKDFDFNLDLTPIFIDKLKTEIQKYQGRLTNVIFVGLPKLFGNNANQTTEKVIDRAFEELSAIGINQVGNLGIESDDPNIIKGKPVSAELNFQRDPSHRIH